MKHQTHYFIRSFIIFLTSIVLMLLTAKATLAAKGFEVVSPKLKYEGFSYSVWSAKWFQFAYSLPYTRNPILDTANCKIGQKGSVWFLGGPTDKFPAKGRNCTMPYGTALFFTQGAYSWDNEACSSDNKHIQKTNFTVAELRAKAKHDLNNVFGARNLIIDGMEVKGLPKTCNPKKLTSCQSPYRVQTPVFDYKVPSVNNLLISVNGACYKNLNKGKPYIVKGAIGDGYFVMIKPLSVGKHTLQFGEPDAKGKLPGLYNITVSK
ncbi:hypothetical protein [Crenothrix polyspora]|uniref:Uncharacterized protein n=1 Tax=Crenothrix polyspora TaxID=360316 RepID=A0A1R4H7Q4_9GAMM|nr:hypothetical protein [Crenothrix polyspora]SJM92197.1 hypothetical protein CRENPOLYSF1_250013 [Crenothrix polyspora]